MKTILCLGNEFIEEDSLAKKIGERLSGDYRVINIKDSFQLMTFLSEEKDAVILDVVEGLEEVKIIPMENLRNDAILSAHDFDAGYVLKLVGKNVGIVGIPMVGEIDEVLESVGKVLENLK